jgi:hypothetical protein
MKFKKTTILAIILPLIALTLSVALYRLYHSTDNQLRLLQHGNVRQKIIAADILAERGVRDAVPFLIEYLDVQDGGTYISKSAESLSCIVSVSLDDITHAGIDDTCCYHDECHEESENNKKKWREWYMNDYPNWVKK